MKNYLILILVLLFSENTFSQQWSEAFHKEKQSDKQNFYEYSKEFNKYWKNKKVEGGYYYENGKKKKAYGWKQFQRWQHYWESRVDFKTGKFPSSTQYDKADRIYKQSIKEKIKLSNRSSSGNWMNLGPASSPGGYWGVGRINQIAFHPSDNNTFWVTTPNGGVWTTSDGGNTWVPLTDELDNLTTSAIAIPSDYASSKTIYIGSGERDSANHDNGIGVLKSTDGGNTWQTTGLTFNLADGVSVNKLLIHPNNNNIIYAATSKGIYKTSNAGVNWTKIFSTKYIYDMEFKPGDPSIIYASNKYWGEIYKLTNNGNNSERVYDEYSFGARRIELAISPKSSSKLYALVANSDGGLYEIAISNNSGSAFSTLYKPGDPPSASKPNLLCKQEHGDEEGGQGWYDLALIVDPNNANVLYCGGVNTWKSTDGGHSWELNNFWTDYYCSYCEIVHADKHYFAYNGNTLYECNDGGLYKTINGSDWINISNGIINSQIYKVGVSQTNKNDIIVGLQDNGTKKYQSGIWTNAFGGDGMDCFIDYTDNNVQYGEIQRGGKLRRTLNNWFNYTNIKPSNAIDEGAWVTPFLMDPKDHNTIYVGYKHIYKSTDKGNNWSRIFTHNTDDKFRHIAVSPSNTKVIYAYSYGSGTGYLWKTINGGANNNWTNISVNLPDNLITSITVKNDDPNTVWITLGGYDSKVVYQSTNGGNTWSNISSGLPDIPANTIVQNIQNHNKTELYIGTDFGVYLKLGSSNWTLFNSNLPKVVVNDLEIYYDATPGYSKLRAATYGRGLWESDLFSVATAPIANFTSDKKTITPGDTISFTDLSLNAPASWSWEFEGGNPHTSSLQNPMIEYSTPGTYKVKLTVTNSFGSNSITKEQYITVICNLLNYHSTDAEIIAGTYHDLGNKGSVIITDNYDDSNSEPIDIGFDFEYNCVSFSSFILNTNGFIKLGNTPPSKPDLFYQSSQHNDFGLFDSAEPEDVNLISIFNHDLEAGNNPEYRVFTSGTAPNRICTIQFKGIKDKTTSPAVFYDNMEFQIKLYETSNNIEFVYGDWDYGDAYDSFKTAACGLKGSGSGKNQLLVVGKSSSKGWDEVYFLNNNYKKDDNFVYGLNFGNYVSRPKPDQGITYRFIPGSDRNINTNALYALGESSINYGNPQNISALLINTGNNPILNFDVQLNISNANIFTDIITVPAIYPGDTLLVTFASFNPTNLGENNITISVPDDDNMDDNALSWTQRTTLNKFNYSFDKTPDSGYGYTYGNSGMFASKYHISGNAKIESIDVFIFNYSENIGQMVYTAVLDTLGNIIAQSDKITLTSQDLGKWKSFKINDSPTFTNTDILTGFASTESNTSNAYYAMGIQNEKPSRPSTFYWTGIDGGTLNDFGADWGYRFMMGFTAASSNPVAGIASSQKTDICKGEITTLTLSNFDGSIQWQESQNGNNNWNNVSGGSGANSANYTTSNLTMDNYYRAKVTKNGIDTYSNIVHIIVNKSYQISEDINLCYGDDYTFPDGTFQNNITQNTVHTSNLLSVFGCDSTIITNIFIEEINVNIGIDNNYSSEFCEGDSTVLFADCNVNFVWSTGSNDDKIKVYEEGWIFLVATNNDGCQAKDSIYITVHNSPVISGIQGSLNPNANTTNTYSIENPNPNSIYIWEISNGVLKTGQNTPQVEIEWSGNDKGKICVFETNKYNCSSENYCVNVDIITATYEIENQSVIIYPNPVSDHLFIYSKDKLQLSRITIVNYFGEKIMSKKLILKHKNSINITDIPSGVYMIYIESNAKKIMKKIIKI